MAKPREGDAHTAGVVTRPPYLYVGALVVGVAIDRTVWPASLGLAGLRWPLAALLLALGIVIAGAGFRALRRAATNVDPHKPTTALVTDGIYGRTRNPLYVALTLMTAAFAVAADAPAALLLLVPVLVIMYWGVIAREERYLERLFGDAYRDYRRRVRRWF